MSINVSISARNTVYDFLRLRASQRRFIAECFGCFTPGEDDDARNKRLMQTVAAQGRQDEFAALVEAAKTTT